MKREAATLSNGTLDAVEALGRPVKQWDDWVVFGLVHKVETRTQLSL